MLYFSLAPASVILICFAREDEMPDLKPHCRVAGGPCLQSQCPRGELFQHQWVGCLDKKVEWRFGASELSEEGKARLRLYLNLLDEPIPPPLRRRRSSRTPLGLVKTFSVPA